jgi:hypothetical protein
MHDGELPQNHWSSFRQRIGNSLAKRQIKDWQFYFQPSKEAYFQFFGQTSEERSAILANLQKNGRQFMANFTTKKSLASLRKRIINSLANLQKDACSNSVEGSQSLASLRKRIINYFVNLQKKD